ncbi:unnamed protein product, partial [Effrenium voratum]
MDCVKKEDLRQLPPGTTACPFQKPPEVAAVQAAKELRGLAQDGQQAQAALKALVVEGDFQKWRRQAELSKDSPVWLGNANAELPAAKASKKPRLEEPVPGISAGCASPASSK